MRKVVFRINWAISHEPHKIPMPFRFTLNQRSRFPKQTVQSKFRHSPRFAPYLLSYRDRYWRTLKTVFFRTSRTPRYSEEKKLRARKVAPHKFPAEISPDLSRGTKSGNREPKNCATRAAQLTAPLNNPRLQKSCAP